MFSRVIVGICTFLIRGYQVLISPLFIGGCRHWPTCSEYAMMSLKTHGVARGTTLALRRLWRCRPGGSFGIDPVPESDDRYWRKRISP
jgi:hypothetical protein